MEWEKFETELLDAMGVLPLAEPPHTRSGVARVLFQPTFHGDICVTVFGDDAPHVELVVTDGGYRGNVMRAMGIKGIQGVTPPTPPRVFEELAPHSAWARYQRAIHLADITSLGDVPSGNERDGIAIWACIMGDGPTQIFRARSPDRKLYPRHHTFLDAVLAVCEGSIPHADAQRALGNVRSYGFRGNP